MTRILLLTLTLLSHCCSLTKTQPGDQDQPEEKKGVRDGEHWVKWGHLPPKRERTIHRFLNIL